MDALPACWDCGFSESRLSEAAASTDDRDRGREPGTLQHCSVSTTLASMSFETRTFYNDPLCRATIVTLFPLRRFGFVLASHLQGRPALSKRLDLLFFH